MRKRFVRFATILGLILMSALSLAQGAEDAGENKGTSPRSDSITVDMLEALEAEEAIEAQFSVVITFDEFAVGTRISNQYRSRGILFSGDSPFIADDGSNPTSPVLSGTPQFQGAIEGIFVNPDNGNVRTVNEFQLRAGFFDNVASVMLRWFDINGNLLGSRRNNELGIETFRISQAGIASWRISIVSDEPAGFAIDNVAFDIGPTCPPPGTCMGQPVTICGTPGNDNLVGTAGRDVIHGLNGNDTIFGLGGNDIICGGGGNDEISGGTGNDQMEGGPGNDNFIGGAGRDVCNGNAGSDRQSGCEVRISIP